MLGEGFLQSGVVLINSFAKVGQGSLNLGLGGRAVEDAVEEFLDHLSIIFGVLGDLGDGILGIVDGIADSGSTEKSHDGTELHIGIAFAFAGAFTNGATEVGEETVGEFDADVGQRSGACSGGDSGEAAAGSGDGVDGVVKNLGGKTAGLRVGEVDGVVVIPLVGFDGELVGA